MRALVTGSSGFIGRQVAQQLLSDGWQVHGTSRRGGNAGGMVVHKVDLTDFEQVQMLFDGEKFDVVFNCAAVVKIGRRCDDGMVSDNCDITHFLVENMLRHGGVLVHLSSIAAMNVDNIERCSAYGRSKFLSENEVWRGVKMGLRAVVLRPSVVVGLGGQIEKVIRNARRLVIYPCGGTGFVDVMDVAKIAVMVAMDENYWGKGWCVSGWNLTFKDFLIRFGGRPIIKLPRWIAGSMLSSKEVYDGSALGFDYSSMEDSFNRIKNELK